jgi:hypothetical protein
MYSGLSSNQQQSMESLVVFSAHLPKAFASRTAEIGIASYLPQSVEVTTEVWVVKEWWWPRSRPLPNYWI